MASQPIWIRNGYATRNQYRNAKARETVNPETGKNFTSYRQQRDYQAKSKGKPRDYSRERERSNARAQERGYTTASRERSVKTAASRDWQVSPSELRAMREANRAHWEQIQSGDLPKKFPTSLHRYNEPSTSAKDFAGYVISYYNAIVNDEHNWNSVRGDDGRWIMEEINGGLRPRSDVWWYRYFVQYAGLMSVDYYEHRYGIMDA